MSGSSAPSPVDWPEPKVHAARINIAVNLEVERFEEQAAVLSAGQCIRKALLTFPPYEFAVNIFPNGVSADRKGRLCIFIGRRDTTASLVMGECSIELFLPDWRPLPGDDLSRATARDPLKLGPDATKGWEFKALTDLRRQGFLADGTLRLRVNFAPEVPEVGRADFATAKVARTEALAKQLGELLQSPAASDLTLVAEGSEFAVHWGVLACRSPVFQGMLNAGMSEAEKRRVDMHDLDAGTLACMLRFLYTGSVEDESDPIDSPVGRWYYGSRFYEVREDSTTLVFFETTEENGLIEGELQKMGKLVWFAKLSNGATIRLSLRYMQMWGDYISSDSDEVNKTVAVSPDAGVRVAERWGCLLRAADKYCVQGLVACCEQEMQERLSVHNAATMLGIANEMGSQSLKNVALNFITQNEERMRAVQETPAFDSLDRELVAEVSEVFFNPLGRRRRRRSGEDQDREFPDGQDWARLSNAQLRRACAERDLPTSGGRE
eukprot:CAMPEP_0168388838 /NCGR_PEP_ID=MMETSP0228-20121227/16656_1 /TAXON_ID=133427 /ORGANISM="Protoceratium reticulatum, Strain CCCM 535 (=CCMP 1889)" /LENGTH=493 /DNA_ID=CAMNT_0008402095 /DNA_START=35 /DNA_END=1513 /DNA_ORIENTATION=-